MSSSFGFRPCLANQSCSTSGCDAIVRMCSSLRTPIADRALGIETCTPLLAKVSTSARAGAIEKMSTVVPLQSNTTAFNRRLDIYLAVFDKVPIPRLIDVARAIFEVFNFFVCLLVTLHVCILLG